MPTNAALSKGYRGKTMANVSVWPEWEIVEKIGEGSFGQVYKIRKASQGREEVAALKVITIPKEQSEIRGMIANGMDDHTIGAYLESVANDLFNEIKIMESLRSATNIVTLQESYLQRNSNHSFTLFIRMELLEPMESYLKDGNLPSEESVKLGIDMCSAIASCEKAHIIHRDIKPQNIFKNEFGDYKLGDFGIAKQLDRTGSMYSHKGTSMYMAPEVMTGSRYDHTVDIYSLGIILYRFFNKGRAPFFPPYPEVITPKAIEEAITRKNRGEALPAPIDADEELTRIILKACSYDPADRYQTAEDMKDDLLIWKVKHRKSVPVRPEPELPVEKTEVLTNYEGKAVTELPVETMPEKPAAPANRPAEIPAANQTEPAARNYTPENRQTNLSPIDEPTQAVTGMAVNPAESRQSGAYDYMQGSAETLRTPYPGSTESSRITTVVNRKAKPGKALYIGIAAALLAAAGGFFFWRSQGTQKTIDVTDYIQVSIEGVNGYAEAEASVDINEINRAYGTKISPDDVDLEIYPYENLSNGDEVTVTLNISGSAGKNIQLSESEIKRKVEDLSDPELVNVFDGVIIVTFSGEDGSGTVSAVSGSDDPFLKNVTYRCEPATGLSNGDVIMVTAVIDPQIMKQYGKAPEFTEKDATVVSLNTYVSSVDEMTEAAYGDLYNKCADSVKETLMSDASKYMQAAGVSGVKNISITNVWTSRTYFIKPTEKNASGAEFKNRVVMIMHVQSKDSKKAKRYFYYPVIFDDVMTGYDSVLKYNDKTNSIQSWKYADTNIQSVCRTVVNPYEANYNVTQDIKE